MIHSPISRFVSAVPMLALGVCCATLVDCIQLEDISGATRTWGTAERIHDDGAAPDVAIDPAANAATVWTQSGGITQTDGIWSSRDAPSDGWTAPERISRGGFPFETAKGVRSGPGTQPSGSPAVANSNQVHSPREDA